MAIDQQALASTLQMLLATLDVPEATDEQALVSRLDRVMDAAHEVLQVDGVGLLLLDENDRLHMVGATDAAGTALERGQQHLGLGPAIDCVRLAATIAVADLADRADYADLWRWLGRRSADVEEAAEVRAVLSVPVRVHGTVVGTLNVLRVDRHQWTVEDVAAVEAYANIMGVLLRLTAPSSDGTSSMTGSPDGG